MFCVVDDDVSLYTKNCWRNHLHPDKFPVDLDILKSNALSVNTIFRIQLFSHFVLSFVFDP